MATQDDGLISSLLNKLRNVRRHLLKRILLVRVRRGRLAVAQHIRHDDLQI